MESGLLLSEEVKLLKTEQSLTLVFSQGGSIYLALSGLHLLVRGSLYKVIIRLSVKVFTLLERV